MSRKLRLLALSLSTLTLLLAQHDARPEPQASSESIMAKLPLEFEPNLGQIASDSKFVARSGGYSVSLTTSGARLEVQQSSRAPSREKPLQADEIRRAFVDLSLVGSNPRAEMVPEEERDGKTNYFHGSDPKNWHTGVSRYLKVREKSAWPGIDMIYYGTGRRMLEYDIEVKPGADVSKARLRFDGTAGRPVMDANGKIKVETSLGPIEWDKPVAYQVLGGSRRQVASSYAVAPDGSISFDVPNYDKSATLVIDPVLVYSTLVGGSSTDIGYAIAVDGSGNAYVTGYTFSVDSTGSNPDYSGSSDIFVTEINSAGTGVVFTTYIGGSSSDYGEGIAVDPVGGIHVAGYTFSNDFPVVAAFQGSFGNPNVSTADAFVLKLNAGGGSIAYNTYLGGTGYDYASSIATDSTGAAYVTGYTQSGNFPTTQGSFQPDYGDGSDAFVVKFDSAGNRVYSSYLGRQNFEEGYAIRVNAAGEAYVGGQTCSANLDTPGVVVPTAQASLCAGFVTRIAADGATKKWFTYLGQIVYGLALDSQGNVYVAAQAGSTSNSPVVNPIQATQAGAQDFYIAKLAPDASAVLFGTYLGGITLDIPSGIALDSAGNIVVVGTTQSPNFPNSNAIQSKNYGTASALIRSADGGATWTALNGASSAANSSFSGSSRVLWIAPNPSSGQQFYLASYSGEFKSSDGGATWASVASTANFTPNILAVAPTSGSTIYAAGSNNVAISTNAASSWTAVNSGLPSYNWTSLAVDPTSANTAYVGTTATSLIYKTTTGGTSWFSASSGLGNFTNGLAINPLNNLNVFACTGSGLYISTDGATWTRSATITSSCQYLSFSAVNPNYAYLSSGSNVYVTTNNGSTWSLSATLPAFIDAIGADPSTATTVYAHLTERGVWKSTDGGFTWNQAGTLGIEALSVGTNFAFATTSGATTAVLLSSNYQNDAAIVKISAAGTLMYSTFLGSSGYDTANGVATDAQNNVYVTGYTSSTAFPATAGAARSFYWNTDAFVAKISDSTQGGCTYSSYTDVNSISATGGNIDLKIVTQPGCTWSVSGLPSWIPDDSAITSGTGIAGIHLRVLSNTSVGASSRTATLSVGGQSIPFTQLGATTCTFAMAPTGLTLPPEATSGAVNLLTEPGCAWQLTAAQPGWLTVSPVSGSGVAVITLSAPANVSNASRSVTVTVDGLITGGNGATSVSVTQAGMCATLVFPATTVTMADAGGSGSFQVLAPSGCPWAYYPPSWITLTPSSGHSSATVNYSVAPNASSTSRSQSFGAYTILQSGTACTYSLSSAVGSAHVTIGSATTAAADQNGGTAGFNVNTNAGTCGYPVTSNNFWLTVNSAPTPVGGSTVSFTVYPNWNSYTRSGTITAGSQTFTVNQAAGSGLYDNTEFVQQLYLDIVGRPADSSGLQYWVGQIAATSRAQVALSIYNATDFPTNGGFVVQAYKAVLGRLPDYAGFEYWLGQLRAGTTQLQVTSGFVASPEFQATYGALNDTQFITLVYNNVLGRAPDPGGLSYWVGQLELPSGAMSRSQVMLGFIQSTEYQQSSLPSVDATLLYAAFYGTSPITDATGYATWLSFFNTGGTLQNAISQFIVAPQYFSRLQ